MEINFITPGHDLVARQGRLTRSVWAASGTAGQTSVELMTTVTPLWEEVWGTRDLPFT